MQNSSLCSLVCSQIRRKTSLVSPSSLSQNAGVLLTERCSLEPQACFYYDLRTSQNANKESILPWRNSVDEATEYFSLQRDRSKRRTKTHKKLQIEYSFHICDQISRFV